MNEIIKTILTRRSIRSYTDQQVSDENLKIILRCASYAPCGRNAQSWFFLAIRDKQVRNYINDTIVNTIFKNNEDKYIEILNEIKKYIVLPFDCFYNAPVVIFITNTFDSKSSEPRLDCAAAIQNILLSAHSLGISTCWINMLASIYHINDIKNMFITLGIPKNHFIVGCVALGYAQNEYSYDKKINDNVYKII